MAQQTKPPTLPPIFNGPQGQQDIARFEAHIKTYGMNKSTWATELRALLRGDLTNLAMAIHPEELGNYDAQKQQLYAHVGVSKSTQFNNCFTPKINLAETITQMGYRTAEAARTCTRDCTSVKEVFDLVTREIVYKQLNPRITTHVRVQKPTSLQELLSIADEYGADSDRGRESAWSRNTVNPKSTYQKPHRPFNGHKFQQQQPQAQNQSQTQPMRQPQTQPQINQPKPFPPFQQQVAVRPPINTSAQHGGSDERPFKPQHKLAKYLDKDKGPLCFNCQKWGHLRAVCPDRNVLAVSTDDQENISPTPTFMPKLFLVGSIFGKPVRFLLDSGADHSLINSNI